MIFKTLIKIIPVAVFLLSCEKIVDNVDLPDVKPKLVVFSYISPETDTVFANVALSRTLNQSFSDDNIFVSNANVKISGNGGQELALQFDMNTRKYYALAPHGFFQPEAQYRIQAGTPDGKTAEATCIIPPRNTSMRVTQVDSIMIEDRMRYKFRIEFDDIPGTPHHYRILPFAIMQVEWDGEIYQYEDGISFTYGEELVSTSDRDGETFVAEVYMDVWKNLYWGDEELIGLKIHFLSIDEHYYHFHHSLMRYVPDNPFSEPTVVYSNVENGLGVFAGYQSFMLEFAM